MRIPKELLYLILAAFARGQTDDEEDDIIGDDDGLPNGGLCYYDSNCLFACVEVVTPEACLNYVFDGPFQAPPTRKLNEAGRPLNRRMQNLMDHYTQERNLQLDGSVPFDVPYFRANAAMSECVATSDGKLMSHGARCFYS